MLKRCEARNLPVGLHIADIEYRAQVVHPDSVHSDRSGELSVGAVSKWGQNWSFWWGWRAHFAVRMDAYRNLFVF